MKAFTARSGWLTDEGLRLDATAYAGGGLQARDRLRSGGWDLIRLDRAARVFNESRFARTYVADPGNGVTYITGSDMLLADLTGLLLLSIRRTQQLDALRVRAGWTLMSCSGTIGRTTYVRGEMDGFAASHDVIRIIPDEAQVQSGFLFAFLSSAPAQAMIQQKTYGSVVQHIEPHHIADLPVPLPDEALERRVQGLVTSAAAKRTEASRLLDAAGAYFDALAGPMPSAHDHARAAGIITRRALDGRLDAFHHVGWAAEADSPRGTPIGSLGRVSRPGIFKRIFVERGVPFVSGIDAYQVRVGYRTRLMRTEAERAGCLLTGGEILVQRSGQRYGLLGRPAYAYGYMRDWAASEDLIRIAPEREKDRAPVFAFLRCESGRRAAVRTSYGTSIPHLNPEGIAAVQIPALPEELAAGANRALVLREEADAEEERAIREVEAWLS